MTTPMELAQKIAGKSGSEFLAMFALPAAKRTYVVVRNDGGYAAVLPLLTITSLAYQVDAST